MPMNLPRALSDYDSATIGNLGEALISRIEADPFNLVATFIFFSAVLHTFFAPRFTALAHHYTQEHAATGGEGPSFKAVLFEFLGEIEVIFGLWCFPLMLAMACFYDWKHVVDYFNHGVNYSEAVFVGVIMAMASTRPILSFAEGAVRRLAHIGGLKPSAWWLAILMVGPLLGSIITEPAAMTIAALLLAKQFYHYRPSNRLCYATLGLLFVNVSVGGTLTHFAAPPVIMIVGPWNWDFSTVFMGLGIKAILGILLSNVLYYCIFRKDLKALDDGAAAHKEETLPKTAIPSWVFLTHVFFMAWTVFNLHHPIFCFAGLLFFLGFVKASGRYQSVLNIRSPLLVSFFLAGLVTHGTLQGWWLEVVLSRLGEWSLFTGATILTAFNDNAAITFLASLVPAFSSDPILQHAVVAGAVTGGGLTVIANAPNPAGQSLLSRFFPEGVSPLYLFLGALAPTVIMGFFLML